MSDSAFSLPDRGSSKPILLEVGITCGWLREGRILNLQLSNVSRTTIDAMMRAIDAALESWPPDEPILMLVEMAALPLTPHLRSKSEWIADRHGHKPGRTAVVMRPSTFLTMIRWFVESELRRRAPGGDPHLFTSRDEALAWLDELLD